MESLVKIVQDLSKVRSVPEIVNIVRKAARSATGADGATFVMKDNGYCFYVDEDAIGPLWKGKRFPLTACISGWAMLNKPPLNSIMGWSEMLSDRDADPSLLPVGMDAINRNTKTQGQVIDRLLDASQIVLGKFAVHKQEIDLVSLIRAALAEYLPMAQKKDISVVFNSKLNQALINADADRLRQAMGNLIDNAIKFSNDHNRIFLELAQQGPSLIFKVKDFGAGVDKNLQAKLFDRFSQTEAYITRSHGGLGLGLTIAKSIVNSHQGEIQVSSAGIGQGSEFSISLPYGSVQKTPGLDHSLT